MAEEALETRESPTDNHTRNAEDLNDRSLNYYSDQIPDIKPRLRKLDLEWVAETAVDNVALLASVALAAGGMALLMKRKFAAGALLLAGVVIPPLLGRRQLFGSSQGLPPGLRQRKEIELERYALKAQRGDYGKMEVIPFR